MISILVSFCTVAILAYVDDPTIAVVAMMMVLIAMMVMYGVGRFRHHDAWGGCGGGDGDGYCGYDVCRPFTSP